MPNQCGSNLSSDLPEWLIRKHVSKAKNKQIWHLGISQFPYSKVPHCFGAIQNYVAKQKQPCFLHVFLEKQHVKSVFNLQTVFLLFIFMAPAA